MIFAVCPVYDILADDMSVWKHNGVDIGALKFQDYLLASLLTAYPILHPTPPI